MAEDKAAPARWSHFPHEGDVGVSGRGATMAEAFENAARAMTAVIVPLGLIRPEVTTIVTCHAADPEILLVDWLNAVIYAMATESMIYRDFEVGIAGDRLTGTLIGETVEPGRHEPSVELKGATLTALKVTEGPDGWIAECVVDV